MKLIASRRIHDTWREVHIVMRVWPRKSERAQHWCKSTYTYNTRSRKVLKCERYSVLTGIPNAYTFHMTKTYFMYTKVYQATYIGICKYSLRLLAETWTRLCATFLNKKHSWLMDGAGDGSWEVLEELSITNAAKNGHDESSSTNVVSLNLDHHLATIMININDFHQCCWPFR